MKQPSFGRRTPPPSIPRVISQAVAKPVLRRGGLHTDRADPVGPSKADLELAPDRSVDDELSEWKSARRKNYRLPWRQVYLMASICFGIGYLVLPDSVNHVVQWLLLALGILSFVSSISSRRKPFVNSKAG